MKWLLGTLLLMAVGAVFELGFMVYATYVLLGVVLASRALSSRWIESVEVSRRVDASRAEIGESIVVRVEARNVGTLTVPWVLIEDAAPLRALAQIPARLDLDGGRIQLEKLPPAGSLDLRYTATFRQRGYYQFGPSWIETGDLFGLHRKYRVTGRPNYVLVRPKVVPLEGYDVASRRPLGEVRFAHRLYEDPTRISGVREYQFGDPMNRVHWRATARIGRLHSKTYEPSSVAEGMILLDFHEHSYPVNGQAARVELAVVAAASMANALTQMGQPVGFVTNGRDAADRIREQGGSMEFSTRQDASVAARQENSSDRLRPIVMPIKRGEEAYVEILDVLARLELTDGLRFDGLLGVAHPRLPRNATLLVVLPEVTEAIAVSLAELCQRGHSVMVVWVVFDEYESPEWAEHPDWARWLIAAGVEVRRVEDEAGIAKVCSMRWYS